MTVGIAKSGRWCAFVLSGFLSLFCRDWTLAKHLISKLWNFTYQLWTERNRLLHQTDTRDEFQGLEALELSIKIELDRGLRSLPRSIHSHHFQLEPDTAQDLSTETKKEWLLLIRSAREAHMDAPIDAFTNNDI